MVAPTGSTKPETSLSTPKCSSTRSIVTGKVAALELVENANNLIKKYKMCSEFFYEGKVKINYFCVANYRAEEKKGIILLVINNFIDEDKVGGLKNKRSKFSIYSLRKKEKIENLKISDLFQDITKESYIKYSRNFI